MSSLPFYTFIFSAILALIWVGSLGFRFEVGGGGKITRIR